MTSPSPARRFEFDTVFDGDGGMTQPQRKVGSAAIARAMSWSPLDLLLRRVFIQPWPPRR